MRHVFRDLLLLCILGWGTLPVLAQEPNAPGRTRAALITCSGMIDDGLYKSIRRRCQQALDQGATYLIFEISTYGGLVKSADDISKYLILEAGTRAKTVAYVKTEAISAGAMISVSCQDIIMRKHTTIGDCAPISMGNTLEGVEREKIESFVRAIFDRAAKANNYPQALLRAMVSMKIEVYRVRNLQTGTFEYFETADLPTDPNVYDLQSKKLCVGPDELLTVDAQQAHEYGIARAVVNDFPGALDYLEQRDHVVFQRPVPRVETNWSEELVRLVYHPTVMGLLLMVALLGLYIEFSTPGLGLAGLVSVICFALLIGSKYLVGMANWIEIAIFLLGVLLLLVEIFVIPGFGVAGIAGVVCMLAGAFGMLVRNPPDRLPWPESQYDWQIFTNGLEGIVLGLLGFIVLAWLLGKYLQKIPFLKKFILVPAVALGTHVSPVNMTAPAAAGAERSIGVGDKGQVLSTLRPAGRVQFGEKIVDCVAQGDFVSQGREVEIIEIHGNRVVVRATEAS